jgi:uncharacterized oxidoreductase
MSENALNVLITGGSEGIGRGLAKRYLNSGARVLVTGRSTSKLEQASRELPGLLTVANDISRPEEREALAEHVRVHMPDLNVLINNAGIQRRISLASDQAAWPERQAEIDTLLAGPVHLNHLLVPHMLARGRPGLVVNVSSGGAFIPQVFAPVYSACKAALHSYTVTLRHALQSTPLRVVELIPPAVHTNLAGPTATHGADIDNFCDSVFADLQRQDSDTIGYGPTAEPEFKRLLDMTGPLFQKSAARFPAMTYSK